MVKQRLNKITSRDEIKVLLILFYSIYQVFARHRNIEIKLVIFSIFGHIVVSYSFKTKTIIQRQFVRQMTF